MLVIGSNEDATSFYCDNRCTSALIRVLTCAANDSAGSSTAILKGSTKITLPPSHSGVREMTVFE